MTKLFATTAAAILAASTALAAPVGSDDALERFLERFDVEYDVTEVTEQQRVQLAFIDTSADRTDNEIRAQILSVLGDEAAMDEAMGYVIAATDARLNVMLDGYGFEDVSVEELSEAQKVQLSFIDTSADRADAEVAAQIESVLID